jgi:hypothetical protein
MRSRAAAVALSGLIVLTMACSDREPAAPEAASKPIPTEEVAPPLGAGVSIAGDPQEQARRPRFSGVLPGNFPSDVPIYEPSTLADFGPAGPGRSYVVLQTPDSPASVRARYLEQLAARGYRPSADGATLVQGEQSLRVTFEDARPGTRIRLEY